MTLSMNKKISSKPYHVLIIYESIVSHRYNSSHNDYTNGYIDSHSGLHCEPNYIAQRGGIGGMLKRHAIELNSNFDKSYNFSKKVLSKLEFNYTICSLISHLNNH